MVRNPIRTRRQMPRIYGNLQRERRDWRPFLRGIARIFWVAVGVGLLYLLFFGPLFRVKTVDVQGVILSDAAAIKQAVPVGGSIWTVPQQKINQTIVSSQPVDSIEILRGLPSTVRVVVHEREPAIAWIAGGNTNLLDATGTAFLQYKSDALPAADSPLAKKIASLPQVVDTQNLPVQLDKQIAGPSFVAFIQATTANFHQYMPTYVWDHAEVTTSLYDITFISKSGLHVSMNTLGDSGIEVRNLTRLLQQNKAQPNSTVDLRIDRWAYVHE